MQHKIGSLQKYDKEPRYCIRGTNEQGLSEQEDVWEKFAEEGNLTK